MAAHYVLVGLKKERCRAKNPAKCRYHVGSDGKPLKHYPDAWSADKALEKLKESLPNDPRGIKATGDDVIDLSQMLEDPFYPDSQDAIPVSVDDDPNEADPDDPDDNEEGMLFTPEPDADSNGSSTDMESLPKEQTNSPSTSIDEDHDEGDCNPVQGNDDELGLDDDSLTGKIRKTRIQKMREIQWSKDYDITPGVIQSLNRARAESSMIQASSEAATNMILMTMKGLREDGQMRMELMWGFEDSPALWPELWSTRENDPYRELTLKDYAAADRVEVKLKRRMYLDPTAAEESWSHDVVDGESGVFSSEELHYEAGVYDAVRGGFLKWEDLRGIGAVSCVMTAVESVGVRNDGSPFLKTVNVWCGRKPKADVYVMGDEDSNCGKAFKGLEEMMVTFEGMVAGMTQAMVTLTVVGSESTHKTNPGS